MWCAYSLGKTENFLFSLKKGGSFLNHIAVIGAGTMGRSIATFFILNNVTVTIIDQNEQALQLIQKSAKEINKDHLLIGFSSYPDSLNVDLVIEAVPEKLELKQQVFSMLETITSNDTIFCTNTSGLKITDIARVLNKPERLVGTHFFTPAEWIPLVEVIKGEKTSNEIAEKVYVILKKLGKKPVMLHKEVPGFIGNRLQHAIAREAFHLVEEGVASPEDIDEAVKWSIGLRMVLTGPFEQRDINGIDVHYEIASYLYKDLNNSTKPLNILKEKVEQKHFGLKTKKGFYDWQGQDVNKIINEKNEKLIQLIQWLNDDT